MAARPVVVGVDGSQDSLRAVEWAAREAERHGAPLRIVSVPEMPPRMRAYRTPPSKVANAARGMSARALGAALARSEQVAPGLPTGTGLLAGPPTRAVAESGAGASMLVVGARGTGGFPVMLLGSVAGYAAARAPCPVVVVRPRATAARGEIAVGVRDAGDGTEALAFAFEEAAMRGADLVAVHAWYWFPSPMCVPLWPEQSSWPEQSRWAEQVRAAGRPSADPGQISAAAAASLAEVLAPWRDKYPAVRVRQDVVRGQPARVLAGYSERAELVVLGRPGRPAVMATRVGSIQRAVLSLARGPVVVVPRGA